LLNIASNNNDNNNNRTSIKNVDGRTITSDDLINIRKRIIKTIKTGKLPKKTNLTAFYASDKNKTIIENKIKKIKKIKRKAQLLTTINQSATKKRKITTASINPKSKN
jgi:hypothetical protein